MLEKPPTEVIQLTRPDAFQRIRRRYINERLSRARLRLPYIVEAFMMAQPKHKDLAFIADIGQSDNALNDRLYVIARCQDQNQRPIYYVGDELVFNHLWQGGKITKLAHEKAVSALYAVKEVERDFLLLLRWDSFDVTTLEAIRHFVRDGKIYSLDSILGTADPGMGFSEPAAVLRQHEGVTAELAGFKLHRDQYGHDFLSRPQEKRPHQNRGDFKRPTS